MNAVQIICLTVFGTCIGLVGCANQRPDSGGSEHYRDSPPSYCCVPLSDEQLDEVRVMLSRVRPQQSKPSSAIRVWTIAVDGSNFVVRQREDAGIEVWQATPLSDNGTLYQLSVRDGQRLLSLVDMADGS